MYFSTLNGDIEEQTETKEQLLERLTGFSELLGDDTLPAGKQYVQFLLDELRSESPRVFVLESVVRSFREAFKGLLMNQKLTRSLTKFGVIGHAKIIRLPAKLFETFFTLFRIVE